MIISLFNWRCSRLEKRIAKNKKILQAMCDKYNDSETKKMSNTYLSHLNADITLLQSTILKDITKLQSIRGF